MASGRRQVVDEQAEELRFEEQLVWKTWTIKKAECKRIDAFELWCLEKTLESPLDSKEIKPVNPKGS